MVCPCGGMDIAFDIDINNSMGETYEIY